MEVSTLVGRGTSPEEDTRGQNTQDTPYIPVAWSYTAYTLPVALEEAVVPSKLPRKKYSPMNPSPLQTAVVFEKSPIGAKISLFSLKNLSPRSAHTT